MKTIAKPVRKAIKKEMLSHKHHEAPFTRLKAGKHYKKQEESMKEHAREKGKEGTKTMMKHLGKLEGKPKKGNKKYA
jgi:actin-related protein